MRGAVAVALVLAGAGLAAQSTSEPIAIDLVVDGTVPRTPMSENDFSVTESGEPVRIESVRLVRPESNPAPLAPITDEASERTAATAANRLVAIYLDEYHLVNDPAFVSARAALAGFIRTTLGPRDLVVVIKPLDAIVSLRMTTDRETAARSVEATLARQGDYTPRSAFEQDVIAGAPARIEAARNQIGLSAVTALAQHLGRFPAGRKTLLIFSNGMSPAEPSRGDGLLPGLDSIARAANRARVAVYAMRPTPEAGPAAPRVDGAGTSRDPLDRLAAETTGFVFDGADPSGGLQRIFKDASGYYLLSLEPAKQRTDGRVHPVSVTTRRPGIVLRARAGYSVPRVDQGSPGSHVTPLPAGLKIPRHVSPLIRTWFGQSAGAAGTTSITFVWEPAPRVAGARVVAAGPARVAMTVSTLDGTAVYSGAVGPSGRDAEVVPSGAAQMTFNAPPGRFLVQMEVLDPAGRVLDHDVRDLSVTAFNGGALRFGTVAVFRSRTAREFRGIADGTLRAAPVAARQFSRAEHLVVRIPVSGAADSPAVTAQLQSRFGQLLRELPVSPAPAEPGVYQLDLPLAALASGGYMLAFSAQSAHEPAIVDRLEFVVTP